MSLPKIDLSDGLADELKALKRMFGGFTPGNSDSEKIALYVSLGLGAVILLGIAFGFVDYDAMPAFVQDMMKLYGAFVVFMLGRVNGREKALVEAEKK